MVGLAYRELTQYFPRPGWVEHDLDEIWAKLTEVLAELVLRHRLEPQDPLADDRHAELAEVEALLLDARA